MKKIFFALLSLYLIVSCNPDPPTPYIFCEDYTENSPNSIVLGDTTGMIIRNDFEFFPSGTNVNDSIEVHSDCQNNPDLTIISQTGGGLGAGGYWENIRIEPSWNVKLNVNFGADTIYSFSDTSYVDGSPVYHVISEGVRCSNQSIYDYASAFEDELIFHNSGDVVSKSDDFTFDYKWLKRGSYQISDVDPVMNDTIEVNVHVSDVHCFNMPEDQDFYVAFSKEMNGSVKLGWVKIYHNPEVETKIIEYAIQE